MAETAQLTVRLDLEGNLSKGIMGAQRQLNGLNQSVGRVGKGVGQLGAGFARAGLVAGGFAVAGLGAAAKAAIDFEDAFAGVRKTVDEADLTRAGLSFDALAKSFRNMSTDIPIAATEFARLGETAGALGVKAKDIEEFARVSALMGVTTNLSADEAADAFGRIGTILNLTGDDYQELADSIVAVGNAGASTEAEITEITKRFAAQAVQLGLNKEQMVGLASATASLGFAPERGGTALARVFANMSTNIATANDEGKDLAKGLGRSIKSLQQDIDQGKGLDIFLDVLDEIKNLSPTEAARFLKSIGVTNTSDRTIFQAMSKQLPFVNEQLEIARESQGALLEEANKKFATTASKIQLFKNNIIEAGIAVGEQFLPAVGRALDKAVAALKDPGTKSDLVQLGKDIGEAIDGIDWAAVVKGAREFAGVMKSALSFAMFIVEQINKLPNEIKAAAAAFLVLNKASGGLIGSGVGNIVGGVGGAAVQGLGSRLPVVGRLFAQPVFVTNWPLGGLGGAGGTAGAVGGISKGALLAGGIMTALAAAAVIAVQQDMSNRSTAISADIKSNLDANIGNKSRAELQTALAGVQQGIRDLQSNPLHVLVAGDALANLQSMEASLQAQLDRVPPKQDNDPNTRQWRNDNPERSKEIAALRAENREKLAKIALEVQRKGEQTASSVDIAKDRITTAQSETRRETTRGASLMSATTRGVAPPIVSAIYANRPVTNVSVSVSSTSITKVVTTSARYGKNTGSGGQNQVRPA